MDTNEILEVRSFFSKDKYATEQTDIKITKVTNETVQCSIEIQDKH